MPPSRALYLIRFLMSVVVPLLALVFCGLVAASSAAPALARLERILTAVGAPGDASG